MRTLIKTGFTLLVVAFLLISAGYGALRVHGINAPANAEGRVVVSEQRPINRDVTNIELRGPISMTVRRGDTPSLTVRGEQRLLSNIATVQEGSSIQIHVSGMLLYHRNKIEVDLVLPALEHLEVAGSGTHSVRGFGGERIEINKRGSGRLVFDGRYRQVVASAYDSGATEINTGDTDKVALEMVGSGEMTVIGSCKTLRAEHSGSGELDAQHLAADEAVLEQAGSGSARIFARRSVVVTTNGGGDVEVHGNPKDRTVSRNGSGDVNFRD
ncbi:head GIN domain-containing protein [Pseudoduganella sp. GCM10020061]|uniref:head GIN domain-containing protein n=1 Tax=Pseudoduganella sp. GCM10020061 TaxID=3317345 RepID=UPI00362D74C6